MHPKTETQKSRKVFLDWSYCNIYDDLKVDPPKYRSSFDCKSIEKK